MEDLEKLYNTLLQKKLYTKSFEDFKSKYSSPEQVERMYNVVSKRNLYTKDLDSFYTKYFPNIKKKEAPVITESPLLSEESESLWESPSISYSPQIVDSFKEINQNIFDPTSDWVGDFKQFSSTVDNQESGLPEVNPFIPSGIRESIQSSIRRMPSNIVPPEIGNYMASTSGELMKTYNRGVAQGLTATNIKETGDIKRIAELQKIVKDNLPIGSYKEFAESETLENALNAFAKDPIGVLSNLTAESFAQQAASLGGTDPELVGAGAVAGSAIPVVGTISGALGGLGASNTMALETASYMLDELQKNGYDISNPDDLEKAFSNTELIEELKSGGQQRGLPVAALAMISMGIAGKLGGKNIVSRLSREIGAQSTLGASGEASKQLIFEGEITDPVAVLAEGLGEIGGGAPEIISGTVLNNPSLLIEPSTSNASELLQLEKGIEALEEDLAKAPDWAKPELTEKANSFIQQRNRLYADQAEFYNNFSAEDQNRIEKINERFGEIETLLNSGEYSKETKALYDAERNQLTEEKIEIESKYLPQESLTQNQQKNAIQERETEEIPVRQQPGISEEVGEEIRIENIPEEVQKENEEQQQEQITENVEQATQEPTEPLASETIIQEETEITPEEGTTQEIFEERSFRETEPVKPETAESKAAKESLRSFTEGYQKGKNEIKSFGEDIKEFVKTLPNEVLTPTQTKRLISRAAKVSTSRQLENFTQYSEALFSDAGLKSLRNQVQKKVRNAKKGASKSTLGQAVRAFSKLKLTGINNADILETVGIMAEDLASKTPTSTVSDINAVLAQVQEAKTPKTVKPIEERLSENVKKRTEAETPSQSVLAEIERQRLLTEVQALDEIPLELVQQLEEGEEITGFNEDITSLKIANQARGSLNRATNAINKALQNNEISEEKATELKKGLEKAIEQYQKSLDQIAQEEKGKLKSNKVQLRKRVKDFEPVEQREIELLLDLKELEDAAWLTRMNDVMASLLAGNVPYQEITSLREYAAYNSEEAKKLTTAIEEINPKNLSVAEWTKRLGTKEIAQRARNVLNTQSPVIYNLIYSPLSQSLSGARKLSTSLLQDYLKKAAPPNLPSIFKKSYEKQAIKTGMVLQYLREASLQGSDIQADGIAVGNRDIFGILLGKEKALNNSGLSEDKKAFFKEGKGMANYPTYQQKIIENIYQGLPKTDGVVNPSGLDPREVLNPKEFKMFDAAVEVFEEGVDYQEASNLRRGKEFRRQPFYVPTWRRGAQSDPLKPTRSFDKFSEQATAGKEKTTESLMPTQGSYPVNVNDMVLNYADEVATDYTFSEQQPIQNALMNSAIQQTSGNPIARALKSDYAASLDYEKSIGDINPLLSKLLGARYAKSLFDPIRSVIEIISAFASILFKTGSVRSITEVADKNSWKALRKIQELTGEEIASFKSADIERRGIREGRKGENILMKSGRLVMGLPEYFTAISIFMPVFRREFYKVSGEPFNVKSFINDPSYTKKYQEAIKEATAQGKELTQRIYGPKTKGASRRDVEFAPPKFFGIQLNKEGAPFVVKADSNVGRLISFFGNFGYREQGEFFQSLKFVADDLKKGNFNTREAMNAVGVLSNAFTYSTLMAIYYLAQQLEFGTEEEKEKAQEELQNMFTPEGQLDLLTNQLSFLATSKYGKVSRGAAISLLSLLYQEQKDKNPQEAEKIADLLETNFYIKKPLDLTNYKDSQVFINKEILPAIGNLMQLSSNISKDVEEITQEDPELAVAIDLMMNLANLGLAVGYGTQVPMTNVVNRILKDQKRKSEDSPEILRITM